MMKMWKWDTFLVSFIAFVGAAILIMIGIFHELSWPLILILALVLAAGFTFIKGLLKRISDLEYRSSLLEARIWELEKKLANK